MDKPDPWGIPGARDALEEAALAAAVFIPENECEDGCGAYCTGDGWCECLPDCPGVQRAERQS